MFCMRSGRKYTGINQAAINSGFSRSFLIPSFLACKAPFLFFFIFFFNFRFLSNTFSFVEGVSPKEKTF